MYPPPYHNPVMRSGEWKVWLEASLGTVRNIGVNASSSRDSGTQTTTSTWTEIFTYQVTGKEKKASLSIALGGFLPKTEGVWYFPFDNDYIDYTGNLTIGQYNTHFVEDSPFGSGHYCLETNYSYSYPSYVYKLPEGSGGGTVAIGTGDFTIELWFSIKPAISSVHFWLYENYPGDEISYVFTGSDEGLAVIADADKHHFAEPLDYETWYWLVVQRENDVISTWLDGQKLADTFSDTTDIAGFYAGHCGYAGPNNYIRIADHLALDYAKYTEDSITIPTAPYGSTGNPVKLRVLVNGDVVQTVDYPSYTRQFFSLDDLHQGDVISAEIKYNNNTDVDWWYTYEASTSGDESGRSLKYPAPEYENDDPRWIGRWTDIYRMLLAAEGNTPGIGKSLESDTSSDNAYSYVNGSTDSICTVVVQSTRPTIRLECYSRSLFTSFELYHNGAKIADLSAFQQRGEYLASSQSTMCHDIVIVPVSNGSHEFILKGVASTTESGHMEAQLHAVY